MIFFLTLTVRGPFHRKILREKKYGGTGLISKKTEVLYANLTKERNATADFLQYIYSALVPKNHQKIRSRYLVHEFSFIDIF